MSLLTLPITPFAPARRPIPPRLVLLAATAIEDPFHCQGPLLAQEELGVRQSALGGRSARFHPYQRSPTPPANRQSTPARSPTPLANRQSTPARSPSPLTPLESETPVAAVRDSSTASTSPSPSSASRSSTPAQRPSPTRQVSPFREVQEARATVKRPVNATRMKNSDLSRYVFFTSTQRDQLIKKMENLSAKMLDITKCHSEQDSAAIQKFEEKIMESFPFLSEYEKSWPLDVLLKNILKRSSETARTQARKKALAEAQDEAEEDAARARRRAKRVRFTN